MFFILTVNIFFVFPIMAKDKKNIINRTNQIIIKLKNTVSENQFKNKLARASFAKIKKINFHRKFQTDKFIIKLDEMKTYNEIMSIIEELKNEFDIEYAEPDRIAKITLIPNDTLYNNQWHYKTPSDALAGVNLPPAWDITTGANIVVAVLDTGILSHTDLSSSKILPGYDMITNLTVANDSNERDSNPYDPGDWCTAAEKNTSGHPCHDSNCAPNCVDLTSSSWHGLHVTGTIAADTNNNKGVSGVNWNARILPVRVMGKAGIGYSSDIADGIIWAAGGSVWGVPQNQYPARIINMSLSGDGSCPQDIQNAINYAVSQGAAVVVAAGNENDNTHLYFPANCNGVITVAALGKNGDLASYSNYGSNVFISAGGGDGSDWIYSLGNTGTTSPGSDTYYGMKGTSMATPHVSGIISLMLSLKPQLTLNEIKYNLQKTARTFPSPSFCASYGCCGYGIADAYNALYNLIISISSSTPNSSKNNTAVNVSVFGKGFLSQAQVKLKRTGYPDINCTNTTVVNLNRIDCTFNLTGISTGTYDLYVQNQDGSSATLSNYFTITGLNITQINPLSGYNNQSINVSFTGENFVFPFTAKLSKQGYPDINCTNPVFNNPNSVSCTFNLTGAFSGYRNIIFINGDGSVLTLTDAFNILNENLAINSINPSSGYNDTTLNISIYGTGFLSTSTAKLSKYPYPDINCNLTVLSSTYSICNVDLRGLWSGIKDLVFVSGSQTTTLSNIFNIMNSTLSISNLNPVSCYNNNSSCQITVYGKGFLPTSLLKLVKSGFQDISPASFEIKSSTYIISIFNLSNQPAGKRDVYVYNDINSYATKIDGFNIIDVLGSPFINYIHPQSSFNNENPIVHIYGENFINGLSIILKRDGEDEISVSNFEIISSTYIMNVILPLKNKTPGLWNIKITNPDGKSYEYSSFNLLESKSEVKVYNPIIDSTNPKSIITFKTSKTQRIRIEIYNSRGKIIRNIEFQSQEGFNQIEFDGKDNYGNKLPSGVYIIKIEKEEGVEYKRVVIVR